MSQGILYISCQFLGIGNERKMYLVPMCCITAQVPAMRAPGLKKVNMSFESGGLRIVVPGS